MSKELERKKDDSFHLLDHDEFDKKSFCILNEDVDLEINKSLKEIDENDEVLNPEKRNSDINSSHKILNQENNNYFDINSERIEDNENELNNQLSGKIEENEKSENIIKDDDLSDVDSFLRVEDIKLNNNLDNSIELLKESYGFKKDSFESLLNHYMEKDFYKPYSAQTPSIGPLSSLANMIEQTSRIDTLSILKEQYKLLESSVYKWRSVSGDGNCFYRAFMFSYLQGIIFDKNITLLKNEIIDIQLKLNKNSDMDNLTIQVKKNINKYNTDGLFIHLLTLLELLIKDQEDMKNSQLAYDFLIKSLNYSKEFDLGLVMYCRFRIFAYIKNNSNKFYTRAFQVKLGNLLPSEYETENGEFLFNIFFDDYLLEMFKDAEKIIIYVIPFVFKINLRVLIYENTKMYAETKDFDCYLEGKNTVSVINKNSHYDLIIQQEFYSKYSVYLNNYINERENLQFLINDSKETISNQEELIKPIISVCQQDENDKKLKIVSSEEDRIDVDKKENNELIKDELIIKSPKYIHNKSDEMIDLDRLKSNKFKICDNEYNLFNDENQIKKSDDNIDLEMLKSYKFKICDNEYNLFNNEKHIEKSEVKIIDDLQILHENHDSNSTNKNFKLEEPEKQYSEKNNSLEGIQPELCHKCHRDEIMRNNYHYCFRCLDNEVSLKISNQYIDYLKKSNKYYIDGGFKNSNKIIMDEIYFDKKVKPFKINSIPTSVEHLLRITDKSLQDYIKSFKSYYCTQCYKYFENKSKMKDCYQLPCDCFLCSSNCFKNYFDVMKNRIEIGDFICICGIEYNIIDIKTLFYYVNDHEIRQMIMAHLKKKISLSCLCCLEKLFINNHSEYLSVIMENSEDDIFFKVEVKHAYCIPCHKSSPLKNNNDIYCHLCTSSHKIKDSTLIKNKKDTEPSCIFF